MDIIEVCYGTSTSFVVGLSVIVSTKTKYCTLTFKLLVWTECFLENRVKMYDSIDGTEKIKNE